MSHMPLSACFSCVVPVAHKHPLQPPCRGSHLPCRACCRLLPVSLSAAHFIASNSTCMALFLTLFLKARCGVLQILAPRFIGLCVPLLPIALQLLPATVSLYTADAQLFRLLTNVTHSDKHSQPCRCPEYH